jgi:hypothetical protein
MDDKKALEALRSCANAVQFTAYRTPYEAENSYQRNLETLSEVEKYLNSVKEKSTAYQLLSTDLSTIRREWDEKWAKQQRAQEMAKTVLDPTQAKLQWLQQLEKEQAEQAAKDEEEAKERKAAKQQSKQKRAAARKKKQHGSKAGAGGSGSDSDSNDEGQRTSKFDDTTGMERGSSLNAHLISLGKGVGAGQEDDDRNPERYRRVDVDSEKSGGRNKSTTPTPQAAPVSSWTNVPFSFIPSSLLEPIQSAADSQSSVVCTLRLPLNSPFAEITFTRTVEECPAPPVPVASPPKAETEKGGKDRAKGKSGKASPPPPLRGNFRCTVTAYRAVIAAALFPHQPPTAAAPTLSPAAQEAAKVYSQPATTFLAMAPGTQEEDEDSDEMVLQDTPDLTEEDPAAWDVSATGGDEMQDGKPKLSRKEQERQALEDLSRQLVAQYNEVEDEAQDEELARHTKARDLPSTINRSLAHWHSLSENTWVVLMCHGGYFAGAVFVNGVPTLHKAFHRYVVRKKQGGKQSKHDKTGGSMSSMGGQIRRHHELKWKATVRDIVLTWKPQIDQASLILFVAPGPENRAILTDFQEAPPSALSINMGPAALISPISLKDPRVRSAPLTTHRPTFGEVKRIFDTVSRCQVDFFPAASEKTQSN